MISVGVNLFQLGVGRRPEFTPGTRLLVLRTALALHTSSRDRVAFARLTHMTTIAIIHTATGVAAKTANETREYIYQQVPNGGSKKAGGDHTDLLQGLQSEAWAARTRR